MSDKVASVSVALCDFTCTVTAAAGHVHDDEEVGSQSDLDASEKPGFKFNERTEGGGPPRASGSSLVRARRSTHGPVRHERTSPTSPATATASYLPSMDTAAG